MSIFGDHSDVMNCRQTGFAMFSTGSVQEVMDLAGVAHLAAIRSRVPFLHFFDGFRTSHELNKVEEIDVDALASLVDREALAAFRSRALNPEHPRLRGTVQNGDIYFQAREASSRFYDAVPEIVEGYLKDIARITGREYHLFDYFGAQDAEEVIVAMGSVSGVARDTVEALNAQGRKVGFVQVHLFRPFSCRHLLDAIPATAKRIAVLDRCREMGSAGEPLYQDVCTAFTRSGRSPLIIGGVYGLSSKDVDQGQIRDIFDELRRPSPKERFTVGIEDDVTRRSLPSGGPLELDDGMVSCKFWGLGSDGTVGANKNTVDIINRATPLYAQAYFEFDAKKSFGITKSHLRFSEKPIRSSYFVRKADVVACHNQTYVDRYAMADELKEGGSFLLSCSWKEDELEVRLPASLKHSLAVKKARLWIIDAPALAQKLGLGRHTNIILQAAFFRLASAIPGFVALDRAESLMEEAVRRTYFAKGDDVVARNVTAIRAGIEHVQEVSIPERWLIACDAPETERSGLPAVVRDILEPINAQRGDELPVSAFLGYEDGRMDMGLTAWEKRDIAVKVPHWEAEKCLQCNRCSLVCPHAVLRPYLLTQEEVDRAPHGFNAVQARGKAAEGLAYSMQIGILDCTGCGSCAEACPAPEKALRMIARSESTDTLENWNYGLSLPERSYVFDAFTVKGSQFRQPLLEFSAACAGCGETPYAKLLTQLFGSRAYWANATGCSQAWGAAMPGIPYTVNKKGQGPAWSNSLFENNAEFSLGMLLSSRQQRKAQKMRLERLLSSMPAGPAFDAARHWLDTFDDFEASEAASVTLVAELEKLPASKERDAILACRDQLSKKCFWMYGGDGWAYDIGFGGLDHVLASGEDLNVFIVDTEVYSNTGGQSSKATPLGAVAQFCASGKKSGKKDLGAMFMSYGNIYVAQVAMGADPNQLMKALKEASSYRGPSIIIAYTPCIAHGVKLGMNRVQEEMKRAVDSGYWPLYRFDPRREQPFILDSKASVLPYEDFLDGEVRYASLRRTFPEQAEQLFDQSRKEAEKRLSRYRAFADFKIKKADDA